MKTAVRETSREHYLSEDFGAQQPKQQQQVIDAIYNLGSACIADVAQYLNLDRSTVAARFHELKPLTDQNPNGLGLIEFVEKRKSKTTGVVSEHWRVKPNQQKFLF